MIYESNSNQINSQQPVLKQMGIGAKETNWASPAIDTPEYVAKALRFV